MIVRRPDGENVSKVESTLTSTTLPRASGVLLHITSLPSPYGIGNLGPASRAFVDWLAEARQTWWQVLPLGPVGAGNCPYQSYSSIAGDPRLISPEDLLTDDLITPAEADAAKPNTADDFSTPRINSLLAAALHRIQSGAAHHSKIDWSAAFKSFQNEQRHWLDDFALFMTLKEQAGEPWHAWPAGWARREPAALIAARAEFQNSITLHQFAQFIFFRQLESLRAYAREKNIKLIGDLPIYVSGESADVWSHPELFQLDKSLRPTAVAGVPPDYFSATGQRWGNPLYNWAEMRRTGFTWWIERVRATLRQVDVVRIDHFRGLADYWKIPAHLPTAVGGRWVKAPGRGLLRTLREQLSPLPLIADDLGEITPEVLKLRDDFNLPGMRILQFAFDAHPGNPFLPHNYTKNCIAYPGTHDNDTTLGWWHSLDSQQMKRVHHYAGHTPDKEIPRALIRILWQSIANTTIAPMQDLLSLDTQSRMNRPGITDGNWTWRLRAGDLTTKLAHHLADLTTATGRANTISISPG